MNEWLEYLSKGGGDAWGGCKLECLDRRQGVREGGGGSVPREWVKKYLKHGVLQ